MSRLLAYSSASVALTMVSSQTHLLVCRRENPAVVPGLCGQAVFDSDTGKALIRFSRAGYQALEPYSDLSTVKVWDAATQLPSNLQAM